MRLVHDKSIQSKRERFEVRKNSLSRVRYSQSYSEIYKSSLGEQSSKIISQKYRNIHPSYFGRIDLNVSSNSDVGMSGAFTPFMELFDNFYFNPKPEPCEAGYQIHQEIAEYYNSDACQAKGFPVEITFNSLKEYMDFINEYDSSVQFDGLKYAEIKIVEKEDPVESKEVEEKMRKAKEKSDSETEKSDADIPSEEEVSTAVSVG